MKIENCYGKRRRLAFTEFYARKSILWCLIAAFLICILVNVIVRGKPWSGIVGISLFLFYCACIDRPLLENTALNRLQRIFIWVGILLAYIAVFYQRRVWNALSYVFSSQIICMNLLFLLFYKRRTKNTLRFSFVLFCAAAAGCALAISIVFGDWVGYLLFFLATVSCALVAFFYRRELKKEIFIRINGGNVPQNGKE